MRWLVSRTRGLLAPLAVSVAARILGQVLGVALFVVTAAALVHVAGVPGGVWPGGDAAGGAVSVGGEAAGAGASVSLLWLGVTFVVIALVKAGLRYLEHYSGHWVAFTSLQRLREIFFASLVPQAPAAVQGRAGAELTERGTRDIDRIEVFFAHTLPPAVASVVVPVVALVWLGLAAGGEFALTLLPFVLVLTFVVPILAGPLTWRAARDVGARRGDVAEHLGDDIQGVREVLAFDAARSRLRGLGAVDSELLRARTQSGAVQGVRAALTLVLQLGGMVALVVTAVRTAAPLGDLVVALAVAIGLWGSAKGVDDFASGLDQAFAATERVRAVVDAEPAVKDHAAAGGAGEGHTAAGAVDAGRSADGDATAGDAAVDGVVPGGVPSAGSAPSAGGAPSAGSPAGSAPAVVFDDVCFAYPRPEPDADGELDAGGEPVPAPPHAWALDRVSAEFPAGEWSFVVGVSGSGKSTMGALLMRTWDPESGAVRMVDPWAVAGSAGAEDGPDGAADGSDGAARDVRDSVGTGTDIRALPLESLRSRVALVHQRPTMVSGTLADNLRLGRVDAPEEDLWAALAVAGLDAWVRELPHGLGTSVKERGLGVSGGQLQRLALARALVSRPDVLVLDEALSQLDSRTSAEVRARLLDLGAPAAGHGPLTIIEITHRVDLVPDEALVYVLDRGRVVESGRAGELRANPDGAFTHLEARV
ncbi:ABC transporter ATP-binding protein [Brevibacterium samyangense]|uniref:ABC-type multidrug transport system, ATPase and permease component n=1 Tax=Brevibacterium samyangense TaxID=366888 RepID=A0ABP5F2Z7_9MICO